MPQRIGVRVRTRSKPHYGVERGYIHTHPVDSSFSGEDLYNGYVAYTISGVVRITGTGALFPISVAL
jgi:hypothetical protein